MMAESEDPIIQQIWREKEVNPHKFNPVNIVKYNIYPKIMPFLQIYFPRIYFQYNYNCLKKQDITTLYVSFINKR